MLVLNKKRFLFVYGIILLFQSNMYSHTIGLCIVATGKYVDCAQKLVKSAEQYFCRDHTVRYFIFTDSFLENTAHAAYLFHPRLGWPFDTLKRVYAYTNYKNELANCDYLFACDADMLFIAPVGDEILGDRVATQHPGYVGQRGNYEKNRKSTACVQSHEGTTYFAGGFYGGKRDEFFTLNSTLIAQIEEDLSKNYVALWHDESHLNRYFIDNKPTKILSPSYCYPERIDNNSDYLPLLAYKPKLIALDKNHDAMRI